MKLMTKKLEKQLPPLYSQEDKGDDTMVYVKYFTPWTNWTWYGMEYDKKSRIFFGLVIGFEKEFGEFSLDELESTNGPLGLKIERDLYFEPITLKELKKKVNYGI